MAEPWHRVRRRGGNYGVVRQLLMSSGGLLVAGEAAQPSPFLSLVTYQAAHLVRSTAHFKEAFDGRSNESEGRFERGWVFNFKGII
ncbi:hypothetical protein DMB90_27710 [Raoultella planticola]|uniref:Uncharacterized protein n=1 Tax=Raoultella planticola TaxID=575 RepID=A0A5P6AAY0_RAOPL|nr:hypothetical protein DMB90_27710 [Raoultella planticola]